MPYEPRGEKVREHIKGAPEEVNRTYNAIMRDKFHGDDSDENQSSAAAIAWAQHNKKSTLDGAKDAKKCPECEQFLIPGIGYDACPGCGHMLKSASPLDASGYGDTPHRTTQWECPECGTWNYEYAGAHGGQDWHDCESCGHRETSPTDYNRRQAPEGWNERDQGVYDYDDWVPVVKPEVDDYSGFDRGAPPPRHTGKFQIVSLGELQQPSGVGATQTSGPIDGSGVQDGENQDAFTDVGLNSSEENMALQTWVNFAVDMLNRGRPPEEIVAQLAHDGCPDPEGVCKKAIEQPEKAPLPNEGAQDPFKAPMPQDQSGQMESVSQQPPVLGKHAEWEKPWEKDEDDDEKDEDEDGEVEGYKKSKVRIAGTSLTGVEVDRWEDLWGVGQVKVALDDGGTMNVAPEAIEPHEQAARHPVSEIQEFIDAMPKVEPTRPSIMARVANLELVRRAVRANISKVGFNDQVKLQTMDSQAQDEIIYLKDNMGIVSNANDYAYLQDQPRFEVNGYKLGWGNPGDPNGAPAWHGPQRHTIDNELMGAPAPQPAPGQAVPPAYDWRGVAAPEDIPPAPEVDPRQLQEQERRQLGANFDRQANELAALWLSDQSDELRADEPQLMYAAARYAQAQNGDIRHFATMVQKHAKDKPWEDDEDDDLDWNEDGSNKDVPPYDNDPRSDEEIKQEVYDRDDDYDDDHDYSMNG